MSVHNLRGAPFVILNEKGYYDVFDAAGNEIVFPKSIIRITQTVNDIDKMVIVGPVNVVKDKEEMFKFINK